LEDILLQEFWDWKIFAEEITAAWDGERLVLYRESLHYNALVG